MALFLAADRGGSEARFRVIRDDGPPIERMLKHVEAEADPIAPLLRYAKELEGEFGRFERIAFGVSGVFGRPPSPPPEADGRACAFLLADDAVTAYLGALGDRAGVVCAVGTGTVTLASDGDGRTGRVDGWGFIGGDLGSAHWIGETAAQAALGDLDRRLHAPAIRDAFVRRYADPRAFAATTALGSPSKSYVADFAQDVLLLAEAGDEAAVRIVDDAARHLAGAVAAAAEQAGLTRPRVATTGRLPASSALFAERIRMRATDRGIDATWVAAAGSPLDGAALLALGYAAPGPWGDQIAELRWSRSDGDDR